jgi:hypothetical protein
VASWLTPPTKILLVRSCSSLGIARLGSIYGLLVCRSGWHSVTYNFPIEVVLFNHDSVDTFGIPEGKEAETARTASRGVAHDGAFADLAKLGKVGLE